MLNNFYIGKHARKNDEHDDETREPRRTRPKRRPEYGKYTLTHSPALSLLSLAIASVAAATFLSFFRKKLH